MSKELNEFFSSHLPKVLWAAIIFILWNFWMEQRNVADKLDFLIISQTKIEERVKHLERFEERLEKKQYFLDQKKKNYDDE